MRTISGIGIANARRVAMNDPFSPKPPQEPVPPLSDQAGNVERESAEDATVRANESERLTRAAERRECCDTSAGRSMIGFVQEHPCLSVGIAFGLGLLAGRCAAVED